MTPAVSARQVEKVSIALGEALVTIPAEAAALAYLEQRIDERRGPMIVSVAESRMLFPAIGAEYLGGISAGLSIYNNAPVGLVLLPDELERATSSCCCPTSSSARRMTRRSSSRRGTAPLCQAGSISWCCV